MFNSKLLDKIFKDLDSVFVNLDTFFEETTQSKAKSAEKAYAVAATYVVDGQRKVSSSIIFARTEIEAKAVYNHLLFKKYSFLPRDLLSVASEISESSIERMKDLQ